MSQPIIIAIDGYASTGKSTLARELARELGFIYIDTGAMYRAVTLSALRHNLFREGRLDKEGLIASLDALKISFERISPDKTHTLLNGRNVEREIRQMEVNQHVSEVAKIPEVRHFLVAQQQSIGEVGGMVMDGRDIGTVVFPNARLKIFMTASEEVRTERRYLELRNKGEAINKKEVRENLLRRDHIDSNRTDSPLRQANDARILDNSNLTRQEQLAIALKWVGELTAGKLIR